MAAIPCLGDRNVGCEGEREGEKRFAAKSPSHLLDADAAFTHPSLASSNDEQDQLCVRGIQLTSSTLVRPKVTAAVRHIFVPRPFVLPGHTIEQRGCLQGEPILPMIFPFFRCRVLFCFCDSESKYFFTMSNFQPIVRTLRSRFGPGIFQRHKQSHECPVSHT